MTLPTIGKSKLLQEKNSIPRLVKLLPIVFMIHNAEEVFAIYKSKGYLLGLYPIGSFQFLVAASLFTILGFVVIFCKNLYRTPKQYLATALGFSGMLFLNVFFPHIISAIYYKAYTPGLISAVLLILPLTGVILWRTHKSKRVSTQKLLIAIALGGVIGVALVFCFLSIGYFAAAAIC